MKRLTGGRFFGFFRNIRKETQSVFFKNFLITAGMFVLCFLLFGVSLFFVMRGYIVQERRVLMEQNADEIERSATAFRNAGGLTSLDLRMTLSSVGRSTGNDVFLCNSSGVIVSCSDMEWVCPHLGQQVDYTVTATAYATGEYEALTTLGGIFKSNHYVVARPIVASDNRFLGYVLVCYDASQLMETWRTFMILYAALAVLILVCAVFLEWMMSSRNTRPLREMAAAAHSFSKGNFEVRVTPYEGENEIRDLTDSFNSMAEALCETEKVRREFIANVSHELRTPMTAIGGYAEGILDGTIGPEKQNVYLRRIASETQRLSRLVTSMLDASRAQSQDIRQTGRVFNYSELFLQTLLNLEGRAEQKQLQVCPELPEDEVYAFGDPDSITRVVYNILDNAVKFAHPGSELQVSIRTEENRILTEIADNGEDIPQEELPHVFDRFHKADKSRSSDREGAGLGLYMVKAILDAHDQDIYVRSGGGTTAFTFTLQKAQPEARQLNSGDTAAPALRGIVN